MGNIGFLYRDDVWPQT